MADPLTSYLKLLAGPAPGERLLEIRYRTNGRPGMGQQFVPAAAIAAASELIRPLAAHGDTYVGVLLRDRPNGSRNAVSHSHLLWSEVDATDAYRRLLNGPAAPTAVVSSGTPGHLHAYWLLSTGVPAAEVAELNRKLAGAVGGDLSSVDAARILRPPATLNHKHSPAATTGLEVLDLNRVYDAAELTAGLIDARPMAVYARPPTPRAPRRNGRVPWWQRVDDELRHIPTVEYVSRLAGEDFNAEGKCRCPFHGNGKERTPSLQVYPPFQWACFGCERGGSIYDFASHLWGMPTKGPAFRELRDRLADVFGIERRVKPTATQTPAQARFHRQGEPHGHRT